MTENKGLLSGGYASVVRNKRYIFWFWLLNLTLAEFGVAAFRHQAAPILDNSLYSGGLVRGFDGTWPAPTWPRISARTFVAATAWCTLLALAGSPT